MENAPEDVGDFVGDEELFPEASQKRKNEELSRSRRGRMQRRGGLQTRGVVVGRGERGNGPHRVGGISTRLETVHRGGDSGGSQGFEDHSYSMSARREEEERVGGRGHFVFRRRVGEGSGGDRVESGRGSGIGCSGVTLLKTKKEDPLFLRTQPSP